MDLRLIVDGLGTPSSPPLTGTGVSRGPARELPGRYHTDRSCPVLNNPVQTQSGPAVIIHRPLPQIGTPQGQDVPVYMFPVWPTPAPPPLTSTASRSYPSKSPPQLLSQEKIPVQGFTESLKVVVDSCTNQFACQRCDRRFSRKSDLIRHVRIHLGIRPNVCEVCGKRFVQRSALKIHMRTHTGERPYQCAVCGRSFSDSSSLTRHRRIHDRTRQASSKHRLTYTTPTSPRTEADQAAKSELERLHRAKDAPMVQANAEPPSGAPLTPEMIENPF